MSDTSNVGRQLEESEEEREELPMDTRPQKVEEGPSDTARVIKKAFTQWDVDNSGTISKEELEQVMKLICPMTDEEIDLLMKEADVNGNGIIEYEEFVDWLTKPATESCGRAILDYSGILRPLFTVYDRDGTGRISADEFEECHAILQSSLRLHPGSDVDGYKDPLKLQLNAQEAFGMMDTSEDGQISYVEFVSWMREHLDTQGMSGSELAVFTSKLARILSGIFHLNKMARESPLGKDEEALLSRLLENLAKATDDFEHAVGLVPEELRAKVPSTWSQPPVGLSVQRLKGQHMKRFPVNMRSVDSVEFDVLCVPMPDGASEPENRKWVTELVRISTLLDGKRIVESPTHYSYDRSTFRWVPIQSSKDFELALERLPSELTIFCILKTQANFGDTMDWAAVVKGLKEAVDMGLITSSQRDRYVRHIENQVLTLVTEEGHETSDVLGVKNRSQEVLTGMFRIKPLEVMATLTTLRIVKLNPLWKGYIKGV